MLIPVQTNHKFVDLITKFYTMLHLSLNPKATKAKNSYATLASRVIAIDSYSESRVRKIFRLLSGSHACIVSTSEKSATARRLGHGESKIPVPPCPLDLTGGRRGAHNPARPSHFRSPEKVWRPPSPLAALSLLILLILLLLCNRRRRRHRENAGPPCA